MNGLNSMEQAVLDKLLSGDHPVLATLRKQASKGRLTKREYTGVGFFCSFEISADTPTVAGVSDFEIDDVHGEVKGLAHGIGFVLFIRGGRLDMLEGFTYDEPWPESVKGVHLRYSHDQRDLSVFA